MSRLLVSVRDENEARAAIEGGADWIDIKEPSRGSLGRADDAVIQNIVAAVAGRRPISAAMGELCDWSADLGLNIHPSVRLLKIGLANCGHWREAWHRWRASIDRFNQTTRSVLVCYVDLQQIDDILQTAFDARPAAVLLDTSRKVGGSLLDYVSLPQLDSVIDSCHRSQLPIAVAGSLDESAIRQLVPLRPDWIAVRTAACGGGRLGRVDAERVRKLAAIINPACSSFSERLPSCAAPDSSEDTAWYIDGSRP